MVKVFQFQLYIIDSSLAPLRFEQPGSIPTPHTLKRSQAHGSVRGQSANRIFAQRLNVDLHRRLSNLSI